MALIAIAVKHVTPELKGRLEECVLSLYKTGNQALIEEKFISNWTHFLCPLPKQYLLDKTEKIMRRRLADYLSQYIVSEQALFYLEKIIARSYHYLPLSEKKLVLALAEKYYLAHPSISQGGHVYTEVQHCLHECLDKEDYVNLHGLICFRLPLWLKLLHKSVDQAVDEFLLEKEYQEFIGLLKYFVSLQKPKISRLHVTLNQEGLFQLLDQQLEPLEEWEQGVDWESYEVTNNVEDQLVSMLITAAPHRIILHKDVYTNYPKAAETLKEVFDNRLTLCECCKLCSDFCSEFNLKERT
ncbi:MAG: hypothetical protein GX922_03585 [Firmicutes bacterium]|nr:hypothetical protein [Bacillota bacterium]